MSEFSVNIDTIPAEHDCFGKPSDYENRLRPRLNVEIPDEALGKVWVSSAPPPADKTDWLWARKDSTGKPLAIFSFYRNLWKPWYPDYASAGVTVLQPFTGDPTAVVEPWAVADGTDGTTDMRAQFVLPAGETIEDAADPVTQPVLLGYMQFVGYT